MTAIILALRAATAIAVLTTLVGGIPRIAQAALALTIGLWSASAFLPAHPTYMGWELAIQEIAIGATLGVVAAIPLLAAQTAGRLVDLAGASRGPYAALFGILSAAVFVGINGHVAFLSALAESHRTLPALADARPSVLAALATLIPIALRLSIPWLVTAAIVQLALGAATRLASRASAHVSTATAVPAALVMMTASLISTLAIALVSVFR